MPTFVEMIVPKRSKLDQQTFLGNETELVPTVTKTPEELDLLQFASSHARSGSQATDLGEKPLVLYDPARFLRPLSSFQPNRNK